MEQDFYVPRAMPFLEVRTTTRSTSQYSPHFHESVCVGAITEGATRLTLKDETFFLETGDLVLIPPGAVHSCNPEGGVPRSYRMLYLDARWCRALAEDVLGWKGIRFDRAAVRDMNLFEKLQELALAEFDGPESLQAFTGFMVSLLRFCAADARGCSKDSIGREHMLRVAVSEALGGDEGAIPSVSALARAAGMRRESFSRAVRRAVGVSPLAYAHALRVEKARALLRNGESIPQAALMAGYADQSHFHHAFVRYFSATPGVYRKGLSRSYKK